MQPVPNNSSKQLEKSTLMESYHFYQKKKLLVLDIKYPIESVDSPNYCIRCGQPIKQLTQHIKVNVPSTSDQETTFAVVMALSFFAAIIGAIQFSKVFNLWWLVLVLIGSIVVFISRKKFKINYLKLNYGFCDIHLKKNERQKKLSYYSAILGMIIFVCFLWLSFKGVEEITIAGYSIKIYAILLIVLFFTYIYPLTFWQPLKLYNQKIFKKSQTARFYFIGCDKRFLNYLPNITE